MSKAIYEELVAAGAPELPEGYYVLVRECAVSMFDMVSITVKKERVKLWDKTIGKERMLLRGRGDKTQAERIAYCVKEIWQTHLRWTNQRDILEEAGMRKYIGRHP